jgi:hypothetical protein
MMASRALARSVAKRFAINRGGLGLGAGVRPRREQRLFEMELPGDAELYAQRDFGARRVQGLCDFFYIGLERKRERRRE